MTFQSCVFYFFSTHTSVEIQKRKSLEHQRRKMLFLPALQIGFRTRRQSFSLLSFFNMLWWQRWSSIMYAFAFKSPLEPLSKITQRTSREWGKGERVLEQRRTRRSFHSIYGNCDESVEFCEYLWMEVNYLCRFTSPSRFHKKIIFRLHESELEKKCFNNIQVECAFHKNIILQLLHPSIIYSYSTEVVSDAIANSRNKKNF